MPSSVGTRSRANREAGRPTQSRPNGTSTRDIGMSKLVGGSFTYTTAPPQIVSIAGTFSAFAAGDVIEVTGNGSDLGFYNVTAVAGDGSALTVDPPPVAAAGVTSTIRTA